MVHMETAEDTAVMMAMAQLGTVMMGGAPQALHFHCRQHTYERSGEVDPDIFPDAARQGGCEGTRWIHAHPGKRRFKGDVKRHQTTGEQAGQLVEVRLAADHQH